MPKPEVERPQQEAPPVRPPTLPPDIPDISQNPSYDFQPAPDPSATPDKVAGTMFAPAERETQGGTPCFGAVRLGGLPGAALWADPQPEWNPKPR